MSRPKRDRENAQRASTSVTCQICDATTILGPENTARLCGECGNPIRKDHVEATEQQQLAACHAAALSLLLAGLTDDGRVGTETARIIAAGDRVAGAVLGFLTAHASKEFIRKHKGRRGAISAVTLELTSMIALANGAQP
jgi:hypothetical protein